MKSDFNDVANVIMKIILAGMCWLMLYSIPRLAHHCLFSFFFEIITYFSNVNLLSFNYFVFLHWPLCLLLIIFCPVLFISNLIPNQKKEYFGWDDINYTKYVVIDCCGMIPLLIAFLIDTIFLVKHFEGNQRENTLELISLGLLGIVYPLGLLCLLKSDFCPTTFLLSREAINEYRKAVRKCFGESGCIVDCSRAAKICCKLCHKRREGQQGEVEIEEVSRRATRVTVISNEPQMEPVPPYAPKEEMVPVKGV